MLITDDWISDMNVDVFALRYFSYTPNTCAFGGKSVIISNCQIQTTFQIKYFWRLMKEKNKYDVIRTERIEVKDRAVNISR